MSEGDKAKFIIPSHLGHGLLGDFRKIPPLQVLVINIEIVKITKKIVKMIFSVNENDLKMFFKFRVFTILCQLLYGFI
jgi:hypothetical protein